MENYSSLMKGGDDGAAILPGKGDESPLIRQVEYKDKPFMPPKKARQPSLDEIAVLRAWVAAGAKDDTGLVAIGMMSGIFAFS